MYRSPPTQAPEGGRYAPNTEVWLAIALVVIVSAIRVAAAIENRETFGAEATVALLIVLAPIFALGAHFAQRRGRDGR